MSRFIVVIISILLLYGCAGKTTELHMRDTSAPPDSPTPGMKQIIFPNGTICGNASKDQASTLARIFVDSHNMAMKELEDIKAATKKSHESEAMLQKTLDESTQKILESSQKNLETSKMALQIIEKLAKEQGTGEITVFFPVGVGNLSQGSLEHKRLINFVDFLSRESRGRKVLLVSIGSASAFGDTDLNQRLAKKRSEAPVDIVEKYLINIPHEFFKVYGTGDMYSPKGVTMKEHQRYQHARIIAFFETDQLPSLPQEPAGN